MSPNSFMFFLTRFNVDIDMPVKFAVSRRGMPLAARMTALYFFDRETSSMYPPYNMSVIHLEIYHCIQYEVWF